MPKTLVDPAPIALKKFRERARISMAELAKAAGYKTASGIQRYEDPNEFKEPFFPLKLVNRLAPSLVGRGAVPITEPELYLALAGVMPPAMVMVGEAMSRTPPFPRERPREEDEDRGGTIPQSGDFDLSTYRRIETGPKDLPVYAAAKGSFDGSEIDYQNEIDYVQRPPKLVGIREACAILVSSDSMEPRYFAGELLLINPRAPVRSGHFVFVELADHLGIVKQLLRRADDYTELRQFNPEEKRKFKTKEIVGIHKVVGTWTDGTY